MAITIQTTIYNVIYVISRDVHHGLLKIGKTQVATDDVEKLTPNCQEMIEATKQRYSDAATMGITDMHIIHTEVAYFENEEGKGLAFDDHAVHDVLINSGYKRKPIETDMGTGEEWFEVDLEIAIQAIAAVKNEQSRIDGPKDKPLEKKEIVFRSEQTAAIEQTLAHFKDERGKKMLWNAKMRFGKTLCALEVIRLLNLPRVMILTHRPTVRSGWFDDYHLIRFENTLYGSKNGKPGNRLNDKDNYPQDYVEGKDLQTMQEELTAHGTHYIYFASMQDLRGKEKDKQGNKIWKGNNKLVYDTEWDLIILDEAHEGTQTSLGKEVINDLCKDRQPLLLYLSGTPYNILSLFDEQEIYTWDYTMEQEAKNNWELLHPDEKNPYEGLAQLHIFTYDIGDVYKNKDYTKDDDKNDYFNFSEFFRVWSGKERKDGSPLPDDAEVGQFVHEKDVNKFLDLLCCESPTSYYPFSNDEFRKALNHTLWMLPGVAEAKRMEELIKAHKLHTQYGFEVVNVAGEGNAIDAAKDDFKKVEKQERDALQRVKTAVSTFPKTITLSCGRLTTGVSIPEWTGVLMLRGSYSTGAANYMQTIFRSQTPYKNGAIKGHCYAFDFAPDRTLTVVDDFVKTQPRSRNTSSEPGDTTQRIELTLRHLPVVAMEGGREVEYDAISFVKDVNRAYSDHVVNQGFKSHYLFRNINTFSDADHALLSEIGKLLGGGKVSQNNDGTVIVAHSDLTNDGKGTKSNPTPKDKGKKNLPATPPKKSEKTDRNRQSQRVLDLIFVRMPLLLFGATVTSDNLTLDDLLCDDFIDQESWEEFMPKNFTKATFRQIAHLLQVDVLIASTAKIIEQAREADALPIEERTRRMADIVAKFRFPDKETVLTPWRVVNMHMTDTIGGYDFYDETHTHILPAPRFVDKGDVTARILRPADTRILEINSKSGVYPLWVVYNLWRMQRTEGMTTDDERRLWADVLRRNFYVVCKTRMAEKITRRVLAGYDEALHINAVTFDKLLEQFKDEKKCKKLVKKILSPLTYNNETEEMKELRFNAVVGNPPYQDKGGSGGSNDAPIYQHFAKVASSTTEHYVSLVIPSRWFSAGRENLLGEFRKYMLTSRRITQMKAFISSKDLFPNVEIKGGVCYYLDDLNGCELCSYTLVNGIASLTKDIPLDSFDILIRDPRLYPIVKKVTARNSNFVDEIVSADTPFGIPTKPTNNKKYNIEISNVKTATKNTVLFYIDDTSRKIAFIDKAIITKNSKDIDRYKVFIPGASGSGIDPFVLGKPEYGANNSVCSQSYLYIPFDTEEQAKNFLKYIECKFFRVMVSAMKITQNAPRRAYRFVPLQNFTSSSDIDWSKSVDDIDRQLYKKYNLSPEDIAFIEQTIKPME